MRKMLVNKTLGSIRLLVRLGGGHGAHLGNGLLALGGQSGVAGMGHASIVSGTCIEVKKVQDRPTSTTDVKGPLNSIQGS